MCVVLFALELLCLLCKIEFSFELEFLAFNVLHSLVCLTIIILHFHYKCGVQWISRFAFHSMKHIIWQDKRGDIMPCLWILAPLTRVSCWIHLCVSPPHFILLHQHLLGVRVILIVKPLEDCSGLCQLGHHPQGQGPVRATNELLPLHTLQR